MCRRTCRPLDDAWGHASLVLLLKACLCIHYAGVCLHPHGLSIACTVVQVYTRQQSLTLIGLTWLHRTLWCTVSHLWSDPSEDSSECSIAKHATNVFQHPAWVLSNAWYLGSNVESRSCSNSEWGCISITIWSVHHELPWSTTSTGGWRRQTFLLVTWDWMT